MTMGKGVHNKLQDIGEVLCQCVAELASHAAQGYKERGASL